MDYIGEHLLPGQLGQFFIILSFISALTATFAYFNHVREKTDTEKKEWLLLARIAFVVDALSVFAIFGLLFYLFYHHRYEFFYVYKNSSNSLEFKYIFSAIWSASEGSFLLWTLWHAVLGLILLKTAKKWEGPVMTVLSFAQLCLATMLLGLYFFDLKVGSSPFALFRHQMAGLPLFSDPSYINRLKDGNDLSPLLQNYWMVIHPPVLFLGFALSVVPFSYAMAGLWTKNFTEWIKPALPWALTGAGILGLGIMMGGAWAYESLNFGGYWAWDPVENASLVPWLTLVAGIHTLLVFKHTGRALRATHLFFIITFILVLYSTFLTRSGILGDTSVHSFADLGMNSQLLLFLLVFTIPSLVLYFYRKKSIPSVSKEETTSSREFWMFIGSLVLVLSAGFIIIATSLPVFNKLFGLSLTMGEDPVFAYNRIIIFVAILLGLLTAVTQYLKYKETPVIFLRNKILLPTVISAVIAALVLAFGKVNYQKEGAGFMAAVWIALAASIYAAIANLSYIWIGLKGKLRLSGGSVTHFGFGLMLVGILLSSAKKEILSYNTSGIYVPLGEGSKEQAGENLTLVKGVPTRMGDFDVTYETESKHPGKAQWYYHLDFTDIVSGKKEFTLQPNAFVNYKGNKSLMANPDAKHYWDHDIFTYITSLPDPEKNRDTANFVTRHINTGDTTFYANGFYTLDDVKTVDSIPFQGFQKGDKASVATITVHSKNNKTYTSKPILITTQKGDIVSPDTVITESLVFRLEKAENNHADIGVKESEAVMQYVTLKAYKFPFINILWLGTIIMTAGFFVSMTRRLEINRLKKV